MRVLIAGGGTGGHVIPALAVANYLREHHGAEVSFVGTARGIENRLVPAAGYELDLINVGQLNRVSLATRLRTLTNLPLGVLAAIALIRRRRPDVVFGVGGYASGPAAIAAAVVRVPLVLFEPNVVPGYVNRKVAKFATAAAVHFEETKKFFPRAEVTGVPVRPAFFEVGDEVLGSTSAVASSDGIPTLLLFGGSQGSRALNQALVGALSELKSRFASLRIIHQTGEREYEFVAAAYRAAGIAEVGQQEGITAQVSPFIHNMPEIFASSDLILCRSGASTVAEIAAAAKPAIFVPLPTAADDHQLRNAESLARHEAAVLLRESELTPASLATTVSSLLLDPERLSAMSRAARALAHADASERIAAMIVSAARH